MCGMTIVPRVLIVGAVINGTINKTGLCKPGVGFSADLSDDKLLNKCLHGKTQNANESFNAMIWDRVPQSRYCGFAKMELGVYDAVAHYIWVK